MQVMTVKGNTVNKAVYSQQVWSNIVPGIRAATAAAGYPMSVTFQNATVYTRLKGQPLAAISTEPASAAGSTAVQAQAPGSGGGGLSGGAIAGIVIGAIAGLILLAALAAFGFMRLRKRRQQELPVADYKVPAADYKGPAHDPHGSSATASRWVKCMGLPAAFRVWP